MGVSTHAEMESSKDVMDDLTVHIGQSSINSVVSERKLRVINSHQVQDGCM